MIERETNPKPEGRGPKEGRNPKSEYAAVSVISEFWNWGIEDCAEVMVLREEGPAPGGPQDLGERTALFGEAIISFARAVPRTAVNERLVAQLVGAGTSIGANYCEADDSVSGKEFKQKIGTCRKESKEIMFFLRMIAKSEPSLAPEARRLWREAKELNLIFGAIWRK